MPRNRWIKHTAFFCAVAIYLFARSAIAQLPIGITERPAEAVRDAFSTEHGRLLVSEFGEILWQSVNPECLRSAHMEQVDIEERGRQILVMNGTRFIEESVKQLDKNKLEAEFSARVGSEATKEFANLKDDSDVKKLLELWEPAKRFRLANLISSELGMYATVRRLGLVRIFSPYMSGNPRLLELDPEDSSAEAVVRFVESNNSPPLRRWIELSEILENTISKVLLNSDAVNLLGFRQWTRDFEKDLVDSCIFPRR